jgi:hypothetical protein
MRDARVQRYWRAFLVATPVPTMILLTILTGGAIEPHLPGESRTWNIQYLPLAAVGISAMVLSVRWRRYLGSTLTWLIAGGNGLVVAVAVYAIITLWGEKY